MKVYILVGLVLYYKIKFFFYQVAAKELEEECGLKIDVNEMKELGVVMVSPGGSDVNKFFKYIYIYIYI